MGGGLLQILSYGTQDLTLTGNPEITFFNIMYRRYTNFGYKVITQSFNNIPNFNSISYVNIPKNSGDLLSKIILQIKLPKLDFTIINDLLSKMTLDKNISDSYFSYYYYFLNFYNKLKNIINNYFKKNDLLNSLSYIEDLKNEILKYFNTDQYSQFFLSIDYFFNNNLQSNKIINYNIENYTNASLFKINNNILEYIYDKLLQENISYNQFKQLIQANIITLNNLNDILYDKLINNVTIPSKIKVCWVNKIALYLFNSIEFYIGSNKIYSLSDNYINNYGELYYKNIDLYNSVIGNNQNINKFSVIQDETILYLPIPFWLLTNYGLSFPVISLQYNSLQVKINTKKFLDCIRISVDDEIYDSNTKNDIINSLINNNSDIINGSLDIILLLEFIFLDGIERKKFAQSAHEYLIEQVQELEFDNISLANNSFQLDIFHCCKDMFWFAQKIYTDNDIFNNDPNVFNYTYSKNINHIPTNITYIIEYVKMLSIPNNLFNLNIFLNGLNIIQNKDYETQFEFALTYYTNNLNYLENSDTQIIIQESYLSLNGVQLIGETYRFFNFVQSYNYYNSTPLKGTNIYSFSLKPTEFQPAGTCNMSRISSIGLKLKINPKRNNLINNLLLTINDIPENYKLILEVRNYNVLRLIGGIGATAYTY